MFNTYNLTATPSKEPCFGTCVNSPKQTIFAKKSDKMTVKSEIM